MMMMMMRLPRQRVDDDVYENNDVTYRSLTSSSDAATPLLILELVFSTSCRLRPLYGSVLFTEHCSSQG